MKENLKLRIYLAGWSGESEYRRYTKEKYDENFDLVDPMTITRNQVLEKIGMNCYETFIVMRDKKLILSCDILVAYITRTSFGTIFEMGYAYEHGIPIYVIDPNKQFRNEPWLSFHTKYFFNSIDDCFNYLGEIVDTQLCLKNI